MQNPTFKVFTGPMWSGKTTMTLSELERNKFQRRRAVLFKPCVDVRYSVDEVVSHSGWRWPAVNVKTGSDVLTTLTVLDEQPHLVAVDEAFMIPGIAEVLIWLYRAGTSVVVSSLELDYSGKPFKEVEKILPYATAIKKCSAVCTECSNDAHYTHKKHVTGAEVESGIEVGGEDMYEPRCFAHHISMNNRLDHPK
jgi:thymidine kinase